MTGNRLHAFAPGMVVLDGASAENLVAANHFLRDQEPWTPFLGAGAGRDDEYGLLRIEGDGNSLIANHFSTVIAAGDVRPVGAKPVIIRIVSGTDNYVASTHVVARDRGVDVGDDCFAAQGDALLSARTAQDLVVITVLVEPGSVRNTVLDAGTTAQLVVDPAANAPRPTPCGPRPRSVCSRAAPATPEASGGRRVVASLLRSAQTLDQRFVDGVHEEHRDAAAHTEQVAVSGDSRGEADRDVGVLRHETGDPLGDAFGHGALSGWG
ncbi:hypothetical protein JVX92_07820 [Microbacterium hominis]|nr:hypothetical protein JVX92_07820 [Microbacterium hominis]